MDDVEVPVAVPVLDDEPVPEEEDSLLLEEDEPPVEDILWIVSIRFSRHSSVSLTVDVVVLPMLLVVVTTFPPDTVPFVPEVPFVLLLLPPVAVATPAVVAPAETEVVPLRTVAATVVVEEPPLAVAAAATSVGGVSVTDHHGRKVGSGWANLSRSRFRQR